MHACVYGVCVVFSYEHLDCIWADSALSKLFPQIVELLKRHNY